MLEDFEFLKVLGKGTFGKVILCREKRSSKIFAIKVLRKDFIIAREEVEHTLAENRVLQRCSHPFLTKLTYSFQTKFHLNFVMEFAEGGDLFWHLKRCGSFPESRTRFYSAEMVLAIGYLHSLSIVYRDLKLENVLLDREGHIKLADFGLCKENVKFGDNVHTFCGTPEYLAPEIIDKEEYGRSVDWWGIGITTYEMLVGRLPFSAPSHRKLFEQILIENVRYPPSVSNEARSLLDGLLTRDPLKRLGGGTDDVIEVCQHSFFKDINWDKLYKKQIDPPFIPQVENETDTSYFDKEFTSAAPLLTPPVLPKSLDSMETSFTFFTFPVSNLPREESSNKCVLLNNKKSAKASRMCSFA